MLLPVEAFLLEYDDWPTVTEHGHAGVVTLAADTKDIHTVAEAAPRDDLSTVPREHIWITGARSQRRATSQVPWGTAIPLGASRVRGP